MRLFMTPTSPFARRVRVLLRELGIQGVEEVPSVLRDPESALLGFTPLGKVPALEIEPGTVLTETAQICRWLDEQADGRLLPASANERNDAVAIEGVASGLLDSVGLRSRFLRVPEDERSPRILRQEEERTARALDWLERRSATLARSGLLPQTTTACALGFMDWRLPESPWRGGRPGLAAWFDAFAERPSMRSTKPA